MGLGKNKWAVLDYIRIGLFGPPPNTIGGIDVTYRCNLTCKHCYFQKQQYHEELSLGQMLTAPVLTWLFLAVSPESTIPALRRCWMNGTTPMSRV